MPRLESRVLVNYLRSNALCSVRSVLVLSSQARSYVHSVLAPFVAMPFVLFWGDGTIEMDVYLDLQMSRNKCSRCKLLVLQKSARAANEEMQKQVQFSKVRSCALFCARVRNFALEVRI